MYIDLTVVVVYLVIVTLFGLWVGRNSGKDKASYFLGGKSFGWVLIGFSLFATNISIGPFVGGTGLAGKAGLAQINPELLGGLMLTVSALIFIPLFIRSNIYTIPQFLELRFNSASKLLFGGLFACQFVFSMPLAMYTGSIAILELFQFPVNPENIRIVSLLIVLTVGSYSVFGGLKAVVVTDFVQVLIMVVGGLAVFGVGLYKIGGFSGLYEAAGADQFELLRPSDDPYFPWTAVIPGQMLHSAFFAFCSIQILQRALGAKDVNAAQSGLLLGGFLKILGIFLFTLPGIIGAQLFPEVAPDSLYATMIREFLPVGISGLVLAGMLAALMSSQDSGINAMSAVVALDVWPVFRKQASEREAIMVGKLFAGGTLIWGILAAPFFAEFPEGIYNMILKIAGYMILPTGVCYLVGRFVKRVNGAGAVATLAVGLVLNIYYVASSTIPSLRWLLPDWVANLHFYELYPFLVVLLVAILVGVSLLTAPPPPEKLACLQTPPKPVDLGPAGPWYRRFHFWWVVYIVAIVGLYLAF
ncbi:sodium/solute symporter [Pelagicoccus sp. NFK12]|uniref:Sodium/solute symporter n=1 Tax=Pelagicoccus enzymogenes TaxID=2773457 RepID=A0A927IID7_9BACT|nr:sodium/solute symporter [Pelagicoccus enzymogenes]MBD5780658.1 sodium/solute symporter [Pelagicoccus enzymogenes]